MNDKVIRQAFYVVMTAVMVVAIFFAVIWLKSSMDFENWANDFFRVKDDSVNPKGEMLKFVFTVSGGVLVLVGLYFNYRRTRAMDRQIEAMNGQNRIAEEGNVAERFKNAI
ncbi:hypothetical protein FACS1894159_07140 [Bacteroidia bacterium]|nr:hypothetical protein FACS1894159_07140 [Bacteroidia bacterium]